MKWKGIILSASLGLMGCGVTPEAACESISLGTPASSLPLTAEPLFARLGRPMKGPADTLGCCQDCGWGSGSCMCGVDCSDPSLRATTYVAGGRYTGECEIPENPGIYRCTVFVREDQVVATRGYCQN